MKTLVMILCLFLAGVVVSAQQPAPQQGPHGVAVIKFSWSKERVGWSQDPFGGPLENFDEMRVRARNEKRISDAKRGGNGAEISKAERDARTDEALVSSIHQNKVGRYGFIYKVSLENNGSKPIKSVDWDYVFFDSSTQSEVGRRQFSSEEKIAPGKTKELSFFIRRPPTQTISVDALNKNERANLGEAVVIVRIEYADGSIWTHP